MALPFPLRPLTLHELSTGARYLLTAADVVHSSRSLGDELVIFAQRMFESRAVSDDAPCSVERQIDLQGLGNLGMVLSVGDWWVTEMRPQVICSWLRGLAHSGSSGGPRSLSGDGMPERRSVGSARVPSTYMTVTHILVVAELGRSTSVVVTVGMSAFI